MPGLTVIRPSDATETIEAWRHALTSKHGPTALILTRQKLPIIDRSTYAEASKLRYGGYVLKDSKGTPDIILIATGSEVQLALEAADKLDKAKVSTRVVSMPSTDLFEQQSQEYKDSVLPPSRKTRLAIEAASSYGWDRYVGELGDTVSINEFGASAPGAVMMEKFGFSVDNVVKRAESLLKKTKKS
jgi:transketolase